MFFLVGRAQSQVAPKASYALSQTLQARFDSLFAATEVPGATLGIAFSDGSTIGLATGYSDVERGLKMEPTDRMLQGSVGKTYFAAVALQLVHEGVLDLDEKIATYLGDEPWFERLPNGADATVRMLMNHTSGLVRYEFGGQFLKDLKGDPTRTWTPVQRLEYIFDTEAPFAAGEDWEYSDTNYIVLGMIVEKLLGTDLYDEIQQRLLDPLGYEDTVPSNTRRIPGLVQGYQGPDHMFADADAMLVDEEFVINPQFEWAGGGFASTTVDMARWVKDIHEGRAFDASLLEQAREGIPAPLGPPGTTYGLCVITLPLPVGLAYGHSGFMPGYRTEMYYFPEHQFGLALQVNTTARGVLQRPLGMYLNDMAAAVIEALQTGE